MIIKVPQFDDGRKIEKRKSINVAFPLCIVNSTLSNKERIYLTYLSENRKISMIVVKGSIEKIDINSFEIDKTYDLGAIYQATGFDNEKNKFVEVGYFKRLLEMEKSKISELISLL